MSSKITTFFEDSAKTNALYPRTKTTAVSDANGNILGDVAVYNADTVASGVDTVKLGIDMDLLWTNSAPTTAFVGQTISLDLSDYSFLLLTSLANTSGDIQIYTSIVVKYQYNVITMPLNTNFERDITSVTDSAIVFQDNYYWSGNNKTLFNTQNVPYKIYGIR